MARPWRIQYEGAVYHVAARGNNRQDIFLNDSDKEYFLNLLARAAARFEIRIFAFCLMTNHYHLFLQTEAANLSTAMHWLNCAFTVYFNRRHKRIGHLLQGRFKSVLVTDEIHWLHLSMYIHLNPVRAQMVEDPAEYPWSSFRDYSSAKSRFDWLDRDLILENYGKTKFGRFRRYRKECLALAETHPEFIEQMKHGIILGAQEKLEELALKFKPSGKIENVPDYSRARKKDVDLKLEIDRIASKLGIVERELVKGRRRARAKAYHHLVEECSLSLTQVAKEFGVSVSAVSHTLKRAERTRTRNRSMEGK